jgi:ABC-2 type transport system permease protein
MLDFWGINRMRHTEDERGRRRIRWVVLGIAVLVPVALLYLAGGALGIALIGLAAYIPPLYALIASLAVVFSTVTKIAPLLFGGNDHDILAALPIPRGTILAARLLALYVRQLPFSLLVLIPALVVYAIFARPGAVFYILALPLTLILPLVPLIISALLGSALTWFGKHFRRKALASSLLAVLFIAMAFLLPIFMNTRISALFSSGDMAEIGGVFAAIFDKIIAVYPPARWFGAALAGDPGSVIWILLLSAAAFSLFIALLSEYSDTLAAAVNSRGAAKKRVSAKDYKASSVFAAMYKKELKRLFSSMIYLTNSAAGGVMVVIFGVSVFFVPIDSIFAEVGLDGGLPKTLLAAAVAIAMSFFISMMATTSASFSLEGRNAWIIESLPVPRKSLIGAKLSVDLTMKLPCVAAAAVLFSVALGFNFPQFLIILTIPALYALMSAELGLFFDARRPNYDWTNEAQVVKQGLSVLLTMAAGMAAVALPIIVVLAMGGVDSLPVALAVMAMVSAGVSGMVHRVLVK